MLLAGAGAAVVVGLGPLLWVTAGPAWAFTAPVKIDERAGDSDTFDFAPTAVIIDVDDKVLWTNKSQTRHTVTSSAGNGHFDSGQIPPGGQWERRFTMAGTYTYQCEIHPDMVGRIEVGAPATTTSTAPPPTTTTVPPPPPPTTAPPTPTTTEAPTTTTSAPRPAAGAPAQPSPPVPSSAPAPPPTLATSSTTTGPPTTTTTAAPPTTVTSAPTAAPGDGEAAPPGPTPETPPSTDPAPPPEERGDEAAAGARPGSGGDVDAATVAMVSALVAVGMFAAWTLIRVRPGRI